MKIVAFLVLLGLSLFATAGSVQEPLHEAADVLEAVYQTAGVTAEEVDVVVFKYNYLAGQWHVELSPAEKPCLDCYPAFYIQNGPTLVVSKRIHG